MLFDVSNYRESINSTAGKKTHSKTYAECLKDLPGPGLGHKTCTKDAGQIGSFPPRDENKSILRPTSNIPSLILRIPGCKRLPKRFDSLHLKQTRMESPNHCRWFPAPESQVIHKIQQRRSNDCYFKLCSHQNTVLVVPNLWAGWTATCEITRLGDSRHEFLFRMKLTILSSNLSTSDNKQENKHICLSSTSVSYVYIYIYDMYTKISLYSISIVGFNLAIMTSPSLSLGAWDKTAQPAQSSDDPGCCCAPWVQCTEANISNGPWCIKEG